MTILNSKSFPFFYTYGPVQDHRIRQKHDTALWNLRSWNDSNYWYCEITSGDAFNSFPIETVMSADILESIKSNPDTFLVIANAHEAFHKIVDPLYQSLVLRNSIPPEKIILLSESADVHNVVKEVSSKYSCRPMNVEWTLIFEKSIKDQRLNFVNKPITLEYKAYPKRYLCFNRRWRLHRPALVALLAANDLLSSGYVSLGEADDGRTWNNTFNNVEAQHVDDDEITKLLNDRKDYILSLPNLYLDTSDLQTNQVSISENNLELYRNTLFSVVTETNFYTNVNAEPGRFLSEKTFKPIAHSHPFIIVSVPNMLPLLRSIGYKTFSPWIDESYDLELDDSKRLKKIVNEIKRLSSLDNDEVHSFINGVKDIVEHNLQVLIEKKKHLYKTL